MLVAAMDEDGDANVVEDEVGTPYELVVVSPKWNVEPSKFLSHDALRPCVLWHWLVYSAISCC
jgi:hypothetical protein